MEDVPEQWLIEQNTVNDSTSGHKLHVQNELPDIDSKPKGNMCDICCK